MLFSLYENKFPDCLFMKLHGETITEADKGSSFSIVKSNLEKQENKTEKLELKLTIRFGEQQFKLHDEIVSFGLQGGTLKLNITNGKIPLETIRLTPLFKVIHEIEKQQEKGRENESSGGISVTGAFNLRTKGITKEVNKFKEEVYQVYTRGTEEKPIWVFQLKANESALIGFLPKVEIGTLEVHAKPCSVEAIFEVQDKDVKLTTATGALVRNIGRNIQANLERAYFLRVIKPQFKPYLSRAELLYE